LIIDSNSYYSLVQSLPDIIYRIDSNGNFTFISKSIEKIGYESEELIGKHFTTIMTKDDVEKFSSRKILPKYLGTKTGKQKSPKLFDERRSGNRISKNLKIHLLPKVGHQNKFPLGKVISVGIHSQKEHHEYQGTIGIIRDVSDVVKAEKAHLQAEQHYRLLIDNAMVIISILSPEGIVLYKSYSVKPILGYDSYELIGENESDYIHRDNRQEFQAILCTDSIDKTEWNLEINYKGQNNNFYVFDTKIKAIVDTKGDIVCFVVYSYDITERKKLEIQLKSKIEENEILLKEIHHRVKNNMQLISALLDLQKEHVHCENDAELFDECNNRIMAMSKVHEKLYQSKNFSQINIGKYITEIAENIKQSNGSEFKSIHITVDMWDGLFDINQAIPCGLIVNELLSNAYKHAFKDRNEGLIQVTCKRNINTFFLKVEDNGVGIDPNIDLQKVESMGLQLIKSLVIQLRGDIQFSGNNGTIVTILFPFS
jgi:PAS domain S-box-containing protein